MGNSNDKYIKTFEDQVETCVKQGLKLKDLQTKLSLRDPNELFKLTFEPNKWNIFHLSCWYGNLDLLRDLISSADPNSLSVLINQPDKNGEPPVVLCCVLDDLNLTKCMIEEAKCIKDLTKHNTQYPNALSLQNICVIHDSIKCFLYLIPDLNADDQDLDVLYDLAKNKNSENISKAFERDKIDYDFDCEMFMENEPSKI